MKRILSVLTAAVMIMSLAACSTANNVSNSSSKLSSASSDVSEGASSAVDSISEASEDLGHNPVIETPIKVAALKGPTAMGMVHIMDNPDFEFTLVASPDEVTALVAQNAVDIAAVPANLGAVLFSKTEGAISAIEINTLGVLYIVENGDTVKTVEDLRGKTIFASGQGATPEYALNYMLTQNGIDPATDVTIEYKSEHAECVTALVSTENSVAMLPQPFVTTAQTKNEDIKSVLDLTKEWEALANAEGNDAPATLITGATIASNSFIEEHPELVEYFIEEHEKSVDSVNSDVTAASALMEQYDIVPAAVAEKAIPQCNIVCISGLEMKTKLTTYLEILLEQNPKSVGGSLPDEKFYYQGLER